VPFYPLIQKNLKSLGGSVIVGERRSKMRKVAIGIILTLSLIGILTSAFNIQLARASGPIYIKADGSVDPPTAPITSIDNITYAFTDNIYDEIIIERSNIVIDAAGYAVEGSGTGNGFTLSSVDNVTIKNADIRDFTYGIYLELAHHNAIFGNTLENNDYDGIALFDSSNNSILENTIRGNSWYGIGLYYSLNNDVYKNLVTNNYVGITLFDSSDNLIVHNNFINNTEQIYSEFSINAWDNGCEGNYWSDYNGTDLNGDGIGDTFVPWLNVDYYPLMSPYVAGDINHDAIVDIFDAIIMSTAFGSTPQVPHWNPHCDLHEDNQIDIFDAIILAGNFGKTWS